MSDELKSLQQRLAQQPRTDELKALQDRLAQQGLQIETQAQQIRALTTLVAKLAIASVRGNLAKTADFAPELTDLHKAGLLAKR